VVAMGHERAHAELLGEGQGLLVVGFGLLGIGGVGVGLNGAKLVQRERLVPACLLLPGQVEGLARVLPGLIAASRQTIDLAKPCDPTGTILQRTRVDTFADRLLQQRAPLREVPLERRGIAQARHDRSQYGPVAGGTTEGQALVEHPDSLLQIPLGEVQLAEAAVDLERWGPSAKAPSALKVHASHAWDWIRTSVLGAPDSLSAASAFRRSNSAARSKSPMV
jgi:hypothetical protein